MADPTIDKSKLRISRASRFAIFGAVVISLAAMAVWYVFLQPAKEFVSAIHIASSSLGDNSNEVWGDKPGEAFVACVEARLLSEGFVRDENYADRFLGRFRNSPPLTLEVANRGGWNDPGNKYKLFIDHRWPIPRGTKKYHAEMKRQFYDFNQLTNKWVRECRRAVLNSHPRGIEPHWDHNEQLDEE